MMYYVYLLKGDKYYVGSTNDLDRRIKEHKRGATKTINNKVGDFHLIGYRDRSKKLGKTNQKIMTLG